MVPGYTTTYSGLPSRYSVTFLAEFFSVSSGIYDKISSLLSSYITKTSYPRASTDYEFSTFGEFPSREVATFSVMYYDSQVFPYRKWFDEHYSTSTLGPIDIHECY